MTNGCCCQCNSVVKEDTSIMSRKPPVKLKGNRKLTRAQVNVQ
jgi:hypothetical protein